MTRSRDLMSGGLGSRTTTPRLLDLFCGAGGAAMGYHRAGFDVVGVDIAPQPRYPFEFHRDEALSLLADMLSQEHAMWLQDFDAIHASPPCQAYSRNMKHLSAPQPKLIGKVRSLLNVTELPWIIENVEGSPLPDQDTLDGRYGVVLCGTMFGQKVWRHRWFETSFPVALTRHCYHREPALNPHNVAGRERIYAEHGRQDPEILWRNEMGVEWMGRYEAREAIPPAYTEFIGTQLLQHLNAERLAV